MNIVLIIFLILFKYLLVAFQFERSDIPFILILITFLWILFKEIEAFKNFADKGDLKFLNSKFFQYILMFSLRLESFWNSDNLLKVILFGQFVMLLTFFYSEGALVIISSTSFPSFNECLEVLLVLWVSLYFRLRMKYFNYIFLEVDGPTLSWKQLLERLRIVHGLDMQNKLSSDPIFELISLSFTPYKEWKAETTKAYQTRGIYEGISTALKGARTMFKLSGKSASIVVVGTAGVVVTGFGYYHIQAEGIKADLEKHKYTVDKQVEMNKYAVDRNVDPSNYVNSITKPDGSIELFQPPTSTPNLGTKNTINSFPGSKLGFGKKMSFTEGDSPSVIRLDGSRVEDIFSFFL